MTQPDTTTPVAFRHSPARTVIRHTFLLDLNDQVPANHTAPCLIDAPGDRFEVHTVTVEVAARHHVFMSVTLDGGLIIATRTGPMVTSHPRTHTYWPGGTTRPGGSIADLPDWVAPILAEAVARTREAFA